MKKIIIIDFQLSQSNPKGRRGSWPSEPHGSILEFTVMQDCCLVTEKPPPNLSDSHAKSAFKKFHKSQYLTIQWKTGKCQHLQSA